MFAPVLVLNQKVYITTFVWGKHNKWAFVHFSWQSTLQTDITKCA